MIFSIPLSPLACYGQIMTTFTWRSTKGPFDLKLSERVSDPQNIAPVTCAGVDPIARGHRVMTARCSKLRGVGTRHSIAVKSKKFNGKLLWYVKRQNLPSYLNFPTYVSEDRGSSVDKVLCYKSEGRWFDSRWCHWNFSLT